MGQRMGIGVSAVRWAEQGGMEIWTADLRPPKAGQGLLLTVVFRPCPDGFMRAIWRSASESVTLSADLTEGAPAWHQRSLWLDPDRVSQPGQLWLESKGARPEKICLEWVDPVGWGQAHGGPFVQTGSGRWLQAHHLYGDPYLPGPALSKGNVVEAVLHPGPIRIEQRAARFQVPLAAAAEYARLEFWVAGLGAADRLWIELNQKVIQELPAEVPRLEDPGYHHESNRGQTSFAGWRRVALFMPGAWLATGLNQLLLFADALPDLGEILVRDIRMQVVFRKDSGALMVPPSAGALPGPPDPERAGERNAGLSFRASEVDLR